MPHAETEVERTCLTDALCCVNDTANDRDVETIAQMLSHYHRDIPTQVYDEINEEDESEVYFNGRLVSNPDRISRLEETLRRARQDYLEMIETWKKKVKGLELDKTGPDDLVVDSSVLDDMFAELQSSADYIEAILDGDYDRAAIIEKATAPEDDNG